MDKVNNKIIYFSKRTDVFKNLEEILRADGRFELEMLEPDTETLSRLPTISPPLIISTFLNSGFDWRVLLSEIRKMDVPTPLIFIDSNKRVEEAIEAIQEGAQDFMSYPLDPTSALLRLRAAMGRRQLHEKLHDLQRELRFRRNSDYIVGDTMKIQGVLGKILRVSDSDIPVVITGESGTGKELVARGIHYNSRRSGGPFIALNCSAIPEALIENELFGHEKGSFTGAEDKKTGLFEQAKGGTLFLDEIGELPEPVQIKLLNVLESGEFRRLGGLNTIKTDVRIISATNKNLERAIEKGLFREDLFYRINVFPIKVPPLRERREDIPQIANHFLKKHQEEGKNKISGFSPSAIQKLMFYSWPGNVRELENKVRQAMIVAKKSVIYREDIQLEANESGTRLKTFKEAKSEFEKNYIRNVLRITHGNVSEAARLSGKGRKDFYDVMGRHGLNSRNFRKE